MLQQSNATPTVSAYVHVCGPFDYNKMSLAPMGCAVQIHEKTDKRGTWAYHSVDGWNLATLPEHYRTHICHVQSTRSKRYADTVQFAHKDITNPTISHADKVIAAIADCARAIKGLSGPNGAEQMQQLLQLTEAALQQNPRTADGSSPPTLVQPKSWADQENVSDDRRQTRLMTQQTHRVPRVPAGGVPRVDTPQAQIASPPSSRNNRSTRRRRRRIAVRLAVDPAASARNTQFQTRLDAAPPSSNTIPSTQAQTRISRLVRPTPSKRSKTRTGHVAPVKARRSRRQMKGLTQHILKLENEVHQGMAVMDEATGKLLNFRQLMQNPKYKKQ